MRRRNRVMTDAEIAEDSAAIRNMAREHPEVIPRKIGEYVTMIVEGCRMHDPGLVDLGHVSLQALGLELVAQLTAASGSTGRRGR